MKRYFYFFIIFIIYFGCFAQPGKNGALTVSAPNQILNQYIPLSTNIAAGSNTVTIANVTLFPICPGDLIMIYEAQGATMNVPNTSNYGSIINYNSAGLYEFKYVQSIIGNIVTTQTTFTNSYSTTGKAQLIKVPQYTTLTINAGASIIPKLWKDTVISATPYRFGGLVVLHATSIINNGTITATAAGFRGGGINNNTFYQNSHTDYVSTIVGYGGEKGESISGSQIDYSSNGGRYCRGAPTNGGGGGTTTNAAGGGGANGDNTNAWTGQGVMIVNASNPLAAWSLDPSYISNGNALTTSSGGGRGGYAWGDVNANALIQGPGNGAWAGDVRSEVGGLGGRPLTNINSEMRIYFGGGGGSGHRNNNATPAGSNGGGIVYLIATTGISGSGTIISNGGIVGNSVGCHCDGSAGAGAGGSIVLKTGAIASTQIVNANGGIGGNQLPLLPPAVAGESEGPGGGGGGGFVAISSGGVTPQVNGGSNGTTLSAALTEMISNGATEGATGQIAPVSNAFVIFTPPPTVTGSSISICVGVAINLTTTAGATTYSWVGPNGFTSSIQNPTITNAIIPMSGTYSVTQSFSGCQPITTYTTAVSINTLPTASINIPNLSVCSGQVLNLFGGGGGVYSWSGPAGFVSNSQNPTINSASVSNNGSYTLTVTAAGGCTAVTVSQAVTVSPGPTISVSGASVCINQTINLNANSSASTFLWSGPNGFSSVAQNITFSNAGFNLSGVYNVTVTSAQNCTNTAAATVSVYPLPVPTLTSNSPVCAGNILNFTGGGGITYFYTGPNNFSSQIQNPSINNVTHAASGIYTLTATNFACSAVTTLSVTIFGSGNGILTVSDNDKCVPYCSTFSINTNGAPVSSTSLSVNGQLFIGNTINYCITSAGTYTVKSTFKDSDGCVNSNSITVTAYPIPNADFIFSPLKPVENMDEVIFTNTSTGINQTYWNWFFNDNDGFTSINQNTFYMYQNAGSYPVAMIVKNGWGCADTVVKIINVSNEYNLYVPNAFTPDGDGLNDVFYPKGTGITKYELTIFDRWGELLFSSNDFFKGWDGTFKGTPCKTDTYTWKINVNGPDSRSKEYVGSITLYK